MGQTLGDRNSGGHFDEQFKVSPYPADFKPKSQMQVDDPDKLELFWGHNVHAPFDTYVSEMHLYAFRFFLIYPCG